MEPHARKVEDGSETPLEQNTVTPTVGQGEIVSQEICKEKPPAVDLALLVAEQDREILLLKRQLTARNEQDVIPMDIDSSSARPNKSYRYVSKVPEWKEKIFKKGDDVSEFLALYESKVGGLSGILTKTQEANFISTAIDSKVKAILAMYNITQEIEDPCVTKDRLRKLFSDKSGVVKNTNINHWSAQFAELKMENHQSWSDYYTVIAKKGEQFQASQQNTGEEALMKIEDRMWEALTHRSNPEIKKCLLKAEDDWENGKESMMVPRYRFRSAYEYCIQNAPADNTTNFKFKEKNKEFNKRDVNKKSSGSNQSTLCRYDDKCTRINCRFTHSKNREPAEPLRKKVKAAKCSKCEHFHPGTDCGECWKCHPNKAPLRK